MMRDQMVREGLSHEEATAPVLAAGPQRAARRRPAAHLLDFQVPYARPWAEVKDWASPGSRPGLADVVAHVQPDRC